MYRTPAESGEPSLPIRTRDSVAHATFDFRFTLPTRLLFSRQLHLKHRESALQFGNPGTSYPSACQIQMSQLI